MSIRGLKGEAKGLKCKLPNLGDGKGARRSTCAAEVRRHLFHPPCRHQHRAAPKQCQVLIFAFATSAKVGKGRSRLSLHEPAAITWPVPAPPIPTSPAHLSVSSPLALFHTPPRALIRDGAPMSVLDPLQSDPTPFALQELEDMPARLLTPSVSEASRVRLFAVAVCNCSSQLANSCHVSAANISRGPFCQVLLSTPLCMDCM